MPNTKNEHTRPTKNLIEKVGAPQPVLLLVTEFNMFRNKWPLAVLALLVAGSVVDAQGPEYARRRDVIYGRKAGMALTLDVFTPKKDAKGIAVIAVASGGWMSKTEFIQPIFYQEFLKRGYTVFAVVHGSQPTFTIQDIVGDMNRAVRFIRHNAKTYHVAPDRFGIIGASSGGHLALLQGTAGDDGNPDANDAVERESSRVQAVGCFYAPTDFLNFGEPGREMIKPGSGSPFAAASDYKVFDKKTNQFERITDKDKLREIAVRGSPITHVNARSAPTLFLHGTADELVPLQQSEIMLARLKKFGVAADLIVCKGVKHGDIGVTLKHLPRVANWFDKYLAR
jgi:acetyl esterase/lipase